MTYEEWLKSVHQTSAYPAVGAVFELTLDGDVHDPLEMVRQVGFGKPYDNPENWMFKGKRVIGVETRRFSLVSAGYCLSLDEVRCKLAANGKIPEGQWCAAFKTVYPEPDGLGPIGVADDSWVTPDGWSAFPCVTRCGLLELEWLSVSFFDGFFWRWLVEVCK